MKQYLKKYMRQLILLCIVMALAAPAFALAGARPVEYLPGVTEDMTDPAFWSDLTDDPDVILEQAKRSIPTILNM